MATKIFYNDNRIIIDGHADTPVECQAITAMCDEMANSENFKTIIYEEGHAVFEQVSGGESEMFTTTAMQKYVLLLKYTSEVGTDYPTAKGTVKDRLCVLEDQLEGVSIETGILADSLGRYAYDRDYIYAHGSIADRLDALETKTEYKLPYTASELVEKLSTLKEE